MSRSLDGYAELELALAQGELTAYIWVSLEDGQLVDWGDGIERDTGKPIPWQLLAEELDAEGTSFEREFAAEIAAQADRVGLLDSVPQAGSAAAGPGLRKAEPRGSADVSDAKTG